MSKYRNDELERLAGMFKALSNPQRLKIFLKLSRCCTASGCCSRAPERCCAGELGEDLDLAASTVSHHLKELKQAGLMEVERRGQKIECWVSRDALDALTEFLKSQQTRDRPGRRSPARNKLKGA
jgi:DNA-binding transcriptional ArsR family regulator